MVIESCHQVTKRTNQKEVMKISKRKMSQVSRFDGIRSDVIFVIVLFLFFRKKHRNNKEGKLKNSIQR